MQLADARVSERPLFSERDRWFESAFLQQRVSSEPCSGCAAGWSAPSSDHGTERIGARIARLRRSSLSVRDRLRFIVDRLLAENAAVEFAGGGVDDEVLPSGAHTRILPLAVMMARATDGEPAFDLVAPAPLFAGFGQALVSEPGFADPPRASRPLPEAVEVEIDDGRRV